MRQTRYEIEVGVFAHIPEPLPPKLEYTRELLDLVSKAERSLALLKGASSMFKHIEVMTLPSILKEAVASVRLEGTRTTFDEVVEYSAQPNLFEKNPDGQEAWNYSTAMTMGFVSMGRLPLSGRLICEIHKELMKGVRGEKKTPGQFRTGGVRLGGVSNRDAKYIPPPHQFIPELMSELDGYMNAQDGEAELIRCALIHYQFEAIHPFWDGNGRAGRLVISLYLHDRGLLKYPILNMSQYFETYKEGYYSGLEAVSNHGNWAAWVEFFLAAVSRQAQSRFEALGHLSKLYDDTRKMLEDRRASILDIKTVDIIFERLYITAKSLREHLEDKCGDKISRPTSYHIIERLTEMGFLRQATRRKRPATYYSPQLLEFWDSV